MEKTGKIIYDGITINKDDGTEDTIHIPYNENNILINEKDVILLLKKYGVDIDKVYHIKYFRESMTHKSYIKKNIFSDDILNQAKNELGNPENLLELQEKSFERLEFLGDRVIKLIVSLYLFNRFPEEDEGFMTKLQTDIEDKNNLSKMCLEMGLNKFLILSKHIESIKGRESERLCEDIFEAFFGALFSSNGFPPCVLLLLNLLETQIDYSEKLYRNKNYKDQLLRYYHSQKWGYPEYYLIEEYGPSHKKNFIMGVKKSEFNKKSIVSEDPIEVGIGFGVGIKKRDGEQRASKMALIVLGQLNNDQYENDDMYYPDLEKIKKEKEELNENTEDTNTVKNIINNLL